MQALSGLPRSGRGDRKMGEAGRRVWLETSEGAVEVTKSSRTRAPVLHMACADAHGCIPDVGTSGPDGICLNVYLTLAAACPSRTCELRCALVHNCDVDDAPDRIR